MKRAPIKKLKLLSSLNLPPAVAVPDALALVEEMIPCIGSMLLWSNTAGEVVGGYSTLVGMEDGLSYYATQFSNSQREQQYSGSTFRDALQQKVRAERCSEVIQIPMAEFRQSEVYKVMMAPYGIEDLARVVVAAAGQPRGGLVVFRGAGAPSFRERELRILEEVAPLFGALLEDTADPDIPVINTGLPGHALLDSEMKVINSSPGFRQQLAMLNQNEPGEGPARFVAELPETIAGKLYQSDGSRPRTLGVRNAWGLFQLYLEQLQDSGHYSLVALRMVPINLKIFRRLQGTDLSDRQLQVACGLAEGSSFQQLASRWQISRHSVITHANYLYDKLGLSNKEQLMNRFVWSTSVDPA